MPFIKSQKIKKMTKRHQQIPKYRIKKKSKDEPIENVRSRVPPTLQNMVDVGPGRILDDGRGLTSAPASPII